MKRPIKAPKDQAVISESYGKDGCRFPIDAMARHARILGAQYEAMYAGAAYVAT